MTRPRATEPCDITCPKCGRHWSTQTPRSWWLHFSCCYSCGAYPRINDEPLPFDEDEFIEWLTQDGQGFDR